MNIGKRLRELRETEGLSQGDIEKRTGLFRSYVSRVECGHTTPSLDTLERWAKGLRVPIYQLFVVNGVTGRGKATVRLTDEDQRLLGLLKRMNETDRRLFISMVSMVVKFGGRLG